MVDSKTMQELENQRNLNKNRDLAHSKAFPIVDPSQITRHGSTAKLSYQELTPEFVHYSSQQRTKARF